MTAREKYAPGPAAGAEVRKDGDQWTLSLVRELRHSPAKVWQALTDPAQLREWAPFDADRDLGVVGPVKLSTVGTPTPQVSETTVKRAEPPRVLEYSWGDQDMKWELEPLGAGTRPDALAQDRPPVRVDGRHGVAHPLRRARSVPLGRPRRPHRRW